MNTIEIKIPDRPHGHGLSFKRGLADGFLDCRDHDSLPATTHAANYPRSIYTGTEFRRHIANLVKP